MALAVKLLHMRDEPLQMDPICPCSLAMDLHSHCCKYASWRQVIQAFPCKVVPERAGKTGIPAVIEPPSCSVLLGAVVCWDSVVVVVPGRETHSTVIPLGCHWSIRQRIAGIPAEPWEAKGVFVVFRIKRKGFIIGVEPCSVCLYL